MSATRSANAQTFCAGVPIKAFRDKTTEELEQWRRNQVRRNQDPCLIDELISADKEYRASLLRTKTLQTEKGREERKMRDKSLTAEDRNAIKEAARSYAAQITESQAATKDLFCQVESLLGKVGCLLHEAVPSEADAEVFRWGDEQRRPAGHPHNVLLSMIDGFEPEKGALVAGHRGYYLTNEAQMLNQALYLYGLQFLQKKGYKRIQTPFFMKKEIMQRLAQLEDFDEALYHVKGGGSEEMYLIATSEQPLCALHINESIDPKDLPKKFAGFSTCFRKEAGAAGKDNAGIFRVHQFEKVEQFVICSPHDGESTRIHEEMVATSKEFLESLGIPYRVVCVAANDLNYSTSIKYDVEGWFPSFQDYRELVSASNCLDFQSRKLETRYGFGKNKDGEKEYVHMLNATLCATERTLCAVLENYAEEEGVRVPEVLVPFMGGVDFIPYTKPAPQ